MTGYKYLFRFLAKHWLLYILIVVTILLSSVFNTLLVLIVGPISEVLFKGLSQTEFSLAQLIPNAFHGLLKYFDLSSSQLVSRSHLFTALPIILVVLSILKSSTSLFYSYFIQAKAEVFSYELRKQMMEALLIRPLSYFERVKPGFLLTLISRDIQLVRYMFPRIFAIGLSEIINLILFIIVLYFLSPELFYFVFLLAPFVGIASKLIGKKIKFYTKRSLNDWTLLSDQANIAFRGIDTIKCYQKEMWFSDRFIQLSASLLKTMRRQIRFKSMTSPVMELIGMSTLAIVLWFAAKLIYSGQLQSSSFISFFGLLALLAQSGQKLSWLINASKEGSVGLKRLHEFYQENWPETAGNQPLEKIHHLDFTNVSFRYPNAPIDALHNLNISLSEGKLLAIVGQSGSGKTTVASLLLRLIEETNGKISINGQNIFDYSLESLRSRICVVSQELYIFADSVEANIAYPEKVDKHNRSRVIECARLASAHEFVQTLPLQYLQKLGEKGQQLSVGQKQRICLARAFFHDPDVLILDEAVSALDVISEQEIMQAIERWRVNKMVILIAHRLTHLKNADHIIVLSKGEILEQGTLEHLMASNGWLAGVNSNQQ